MEYKTLPRLLEEKRQRLIFFDLETESSEEVNLTLVGSGRYFTDPGTRITLACWKRLDDKEVSYEENPQIPRLLAEIKEDDILVAHNASFDLLGINASPRRKGLLCCTFAMCCSLNMEGGLDKAGAAVNKHYFKTEMPKSMKKSSSKQVIDSLISLAGSAREEALEYCKNDVLALEELFCRLSHRITEDEFKAIDAHLRINIRGLPFNRHRLESEAAKSNEERDAIIEAFIEKYGFSPTQTDVLKTWLNKKHGVRLDEEGEVQQALMQAKGVDTSEKYGGFIETVSEKALDDIYDSVDEETQEVIDARRIASKSTTKKLSKILERLDYGDDPIGRLKNAFHFGGAVTGRWASKGANMQNNKRGGIIKELVIPPDDHRLYVGDFAQIELRLALWLTGQMDALETLHYKEDFYKEVAARIFGKDVKDIDKSERFFGKQLVLGANYGMGSPKFKVMCANAGSEITEERADELIMSYRSEMGHLSASWRALDAALKQAATFPREKVKPEGVRSVWFYYDDAAEEMLVKLPTKRIMRYGGAGLHKMKDKRTGKNTTFVRYHDPNDKARPTKYFTHGGLVLENICQAVGRDLLCRALVKFEEFLDGPQEGVIAHVHDEVVAVVDFDRDQDQLDDLLIDPAFRKEGGVKGLLLDLDSHIVPNWGAAK